MIAERLEDFLDQLASATPAPGGGAAAALTAAASAAIVAMVCRVTARYGSPEGVLAETEREAETIRARLTALIREDTDAFAAVVAARRAPATRRPDAVRAALVKAIDTPLAIAHGAARILNLCDGLVSRARASTVSDLGGAVALAAAALDSAVLTVRVNLHALDDAAFVSRTRGVLAQLVGEAGVTRHQLAQVVAARTGIEA